MLTRAQKENRAIKLLEKDKDFRYIAKRCHLSLTDISTLKKKLAGSEKSESDVPKDSRWTRAYKLFAKNRSLIDVAINLGIDEKTTTKYWTEYCSLKNMNEFVEIYNEMGPDLGPILELYSVIKLNRLSPKDVDYVAKKVVNIHGLERYETDLKNRINLKESRIRVLDSQLDPMQARWRLLEKFCDQLEDKKSELEKAIEKLEKRKRRLEAEWPES